MTFEASETEKCLSIPIADTLGHEQDESFFVTLQRTDGLDERIQLNAAVVGEIEIIDDDGECDNLTQLLYNTYCRTVSRFMHLVLCFVIKIYTFHQWLLCISRIPCTRSERMRVWYEYVLLSLNPMLNVLSHSPSISISTHVLTVQVCKIISMDGH